MKLVITARTDYREGFELKETVRGFDDAEKIGIRVGRAVRDFVRNVPLSKNGKRIRFDVFAEWRDGKRAAPVETSDAVGATAPKRRRPKKAA